MPKFARTLERIRDNPEDFYFGELARDVVQDIKDGGGIFTRDDLKNYKVKFRKPMEGKFGEYSWYSTPPPGSGVVLSFILNILKGMSRHVRGGARTWFGKRSWERYCLLALWYSHVVFPQVVSRFIFIQNYGHSPFNVHDQTFWKESSFSVTFSLFYRIQYETLGSAWNQKLNPDISQNCGGFQVCLRLPSITGWPRLCKCYGGRVVLWLIWDSYLALHCLESLTSCPKSSKESKNESARSFFSVGCSTNWVIENPLVDQPCASS